MSARVGMGGKSRAYLEAQKNASRQARGDGLLDMKSKSDQHFMSASIA
jgi:hypothetical protein